ncbi:MAG TPA: hypothetical protein IAB51_10100, partial [Candidatus Merdivicinus excrementipullorum]|nr:hypothetical protein [Candidatus Merdivicinus excrementipullorum]
LTSSVNAVAAVVIAVPLTLALRKALKQTGFSALLAKPAENRTAWTPIKVVAVVVLCLAALFLFLYLAL